MISIGDDNDYDGVKINDDDECLFNNQHHHCLHPYKVKKSLMLQRQCG